MHKKSTARIRSGSHFEATPKLGTSQKKKKCDKDEVKTPRNSGNKAAGRGAP